MKQLTFATFFAGHKHVGPTIASTLSTFAPIVALVLAMIVLGETISPVQLPGSVFILAAVIVLSRNEARCSKKTN